MNTSLVTVDGVACTGVRVTHIDRRAERERHLLSGQESCRVEAAAQRVHHKCTSSDHVTRE